MRQAKPRAQILHYERLEGEWPTRFHLRVDPDGGGILLANASEAAYLSQAGVVMAQMLFDGADEGAVRTEIARRFADVPASQLTADIAAMRKLIADLAEPGDNYPVSNLTDPDTTSWARELAAPLQADIVQGDLATTENAIRKAWDATIPHATILAQPDANMLELPLLTQVAEDTGMICGLRGLASWLEPEVIAEAAMAGLDHLDLLYISPLEDEHNALTAPGDLGRVLAAFEQCRELELCPVAQVPLMDANADIIDEIMEHLRKIGIDNAVCFALACEDEDEAGDAAGALPARALPQVAMVLIEAAEEADVRYLWAPPVWFDANRPLADQIQRGPRTAGDVAVRIEADGSVLPARGAGCAGNILTQSWEEIWSAECFARYRERLRNPSRCSNCPDLEICGADCPKDPAGWSDDREGGAAQ